MNYKVSVLSGIKEIDFRELELKKPIGNQVLVKVDSCAICTLEQRIYNGVMKYYPFAGGHEVSGIIEQVGELVTNLKVGNKVAVRMLTNCGECYYCRNGHENQCIVSFKAAVHEGLNGPGGLAEYMCVDAKSVFKVDDDLNLSIAALTEPLACCVHSVNNAKIELGNDVVVMGAGIMGAFHVKLAKLKGARVIVTEIDNQRLEVAKQMGADLVINSNEENVVEKIHALTDGRGADVVFCTAALTSLAEQAIQITGKTGRVIMYSSFHPDNPIDLSVNKVHSSEMIITGAVNPKISDFLASTRLLSSKIIDPSILISESVAFSEINYAFERAIDPKSYRIVVKM